MKLNILKYEKNYLEISFDGNAHTLLNIVKSKLLENKDVTFVGYNKPHPLKEESSLIVKTKSKDPKKLVKESIDLIVKDLESLKIQ